MDNKKILSSHINQAIKDYNKQAVISHQGTLSKTWVQCVLHLNNEQWRKIKSGNSYISLGIYKNVLKKLLNNQRLVFHKIISNFSNNGNSSIIQAKNNTKRILSRINKSSNKNKITAIKKQKAKGRFNIYINNKYAFPTNVNTISRYHLRIGMVINEPLKNKLVYSDNFHKLYNSVLNYIDYQPRTESEIRKKINKINKNNISKIAINKIIKMLKSYHFIDDQHYADLYVESSNKGPLFIRRKLLLKGISSQKIDNSLNKYYKSNQVLSNAIKIASNIFKSKSQYPFNQRKQKTMQTLIRKGFTFDSAKEAITKCHFKPDNNRQKRLLKKYALKAFHKYNNKYKNSYKNTQKMKAYLYRKGFNFDEINSSLSKLI